MIIPKHEMIEIGGMDAGSKDDWDLNGSKDKATFLDNQYWKVPEQFNLDDLL